MQVSSIVDWLLATKGSTDRIYKEESNVTMSRIETDEDFLNSHMALSEDSLKYDFFLFFKYVKFQNWYIW